MTINELGAWDFPPCGYVPAKLPAHLRFSWPPQGGPAIRVANGRQTPHAPPAAYSSRAAEVSCPEWLPYPTRRRLEA